MGVAQLGTPEKGCQLSHRFFFWLGGKPPTTIDYGKKGTLIILTSLLEDLVKMGLVP